MARVDKIFQENLSLIMSQPWEEVDRPKYSDGNGVKVKRILQMSNEYDLRREFPLLSLRPVPLHKCIREVIWIWQKRSVDVKELNLKIWDSWKDSEDKIPGCYGDMVSLPVVMSREKTNPDFEEIHLNDILGHNRALRFLHEAGAGTVVGYGFGSQTDFLLWLLRNDPTSRRMVASMFDAPSNPLKPLQECAFMIQLSVKNGELYMTLYQRSQDFLVANAWNVAQYAALMMMFAHSAGLKPAIFKHVIGDCHVYDRHEKAAEELLRRPLFGPIPQVTISERMQDLGFYDFTEDDFEVWNYEPQGNFKFDVAV